MKRAHLVAGALAVVVVAVAFAMPRGTSWGEPLHLKTIERDMLEREGIRLTEPLEEQRFLAVMPESAARIKATQHQRGAVAELVLANVFSNGEHCFCWVAVVYLYELGRSGDAIPFYDQFGMDPVEPVRPYRRLDLFDAVTRERAPIRYRIVSPSPGVPVLETVTRHVLDEAGIDLEYPRGGDASEYNDTEYAAIQIILQRVEPLLIREVVLAETEVDGERCLCWVFAVTADETDASPSELHLVAAKSKTYRTSLPLTPP